MLCPRDNSRRCPAVGLVPLLLLGLLVLMTTAAVAQEAAAPAATEAAAAPAPRQLTLAQTLALAAENNRGIQAAQARVERALAQVDQANAPLRFAVRGDLKAVVADRMRSQAGYTTLHTLTRTGSVSLSRAIDLSGALHTGVGSARIAVTAAQLDLERILQQTALQVRMQYYAVLRAQAAQGVAEADVKAREEHLKQAQALEEAGVTPHSDQLVAQAQLANARQGLIAARSAVALRRAELNNLVGLDVQTPLALQEERWPVAPLPQEDASLQRALENRVEVQQAAVNTVLAERSITLAAAGRKPTLGVGAGVSYTPDVTVPQPREMNWNIAATFSVPFSDGGLTAANVRQRQSELTAAKLAQEQTRQDVSLEVVQAILALRDSAERVEAARANVAQATEALRLAKIRYGEGIATFVEITDAQALLTQSQANAVNALYDCLQGQARYERAVGQVTLPAEPQ